MLQHYITNSSIFPFTTTTVFVNDVASQCLKNKVVVKSGFLVAFLTFLKWTTVSKAPQKILLQLTLLGNKFKFLFIDQFLLSSLAEGRGGGGGHGNLDWVRRYHSDIILNGLFPNLFLKTQFNLI